MDGLLSRPVVVGGLGAVGRLFAGLLGGHGPVTLVDTAAGSGPPGAPVLHDDARRPGPPLRQALGAAGVVVLALPEAAGVPAAAAVAAHMHPGALLVDTLSVKARIVPALLDAVHRHGVAATSVNPMFAPALGFAGRPVAVVEVGPGPAADTFARLLADSGARPVPLSAKEHDALTASLQVATHAALLAFGQAVARSGAPAGELLALAPPPHRTMLAMLARLVSGNPEPYREIQANHPEAARVRRALREAVTSVETAASPDRFAALTGELAGWLGPHRNGLDAECAALFEVDGRASAAGG